MDTLHEYDIMSNQAYGVINRRQETEEDDYI